MIIKLLFCLHLFFFIIFAPVYGSETGRNRDSQLKEKIEYFYKLGRYRDAIQKAEELLSIREKQLDKNKLVVSEVIDDLGVLYTEQGEYTKSRTILEEALEIRQNRLDSNHPLIAESLTHLGKVHYYLDNYRKAESLLKKAIEIRKNHFGESHPAVAESMAILSWAYARLGDNENYKKYSEKALAIRENSLGPDHPDVAESLADIGTSFVFSKGDRKKAEAYLKRSLEIRENASGGNHPDVGESLICLGIFYAFSAKYTEAQNVLQRALDLLKETLGDIHPYTAECLTDLAMVHCGKTEPRKALPLLEQAIGIVKNQAWESPRDLSRNYRLLASVYKDLGEFEKSKSIYQEIIGIDQRVVSSNHPAMADSYEELGKLCYHTGDLDKAQALLEKAIAIYENAYEKNHHSIVGPLNALAVLNETLGYYATSEKYYKTSISIYEKKYGPDHPVVATILHHLAGFYLRIVDYEKAEATIERVLNIRKKVHGIDNPEYARSLNLAATYHKAVGNYTKAEELQRRCGVILEGQLGKDSPDFAKHLADLAEICIASGEYDDAELYYSESLLIRRKVLKPDHFLIAENLSGLSALHVIQGKSESAMKEIKECLEIRKKNFGTDHPDIAETLNRLGLIHADRGDFSKAFEIAGQAQEIEGNFITKILGITSDRQKIQFVEKQKQSLDFFLNISKIYGDKNQNGKKGGLNVWLRRKGLILEREKAFQKMLIDSSEGEKKAEKLFKELAEKRAFMSNLIFMGPDTDHTFDYEHRLKKLKEKIEELEIELSRISHEFALNQRIAGANYDSVARKLPPDTALIEFARINVYDFSTKSRTKRWLPPIYIAFVLHSNRSDDVRLIELGDAKRIEDKIAELKADVMAMNHGENIPSAVHLYEMVFAPIVKKLEGVTDIFISPDGNLNLIPFEILRTPDGRFLIRDYMFNYVASGRDIIGFGETAATNTGKALLMGNPDFDLTPGEKATFLEALKQKREDTENRFRSSPDRTTLKPFEPLDGTKAEIEEVRKLFEDLPVEIHTGKSAMEEVLFATRSPSVLHLATHGFFLEDVEIELSPGMRGVGGLYTAGDKIAVHSLNLLKIENPLLRSGIALAGANHALRSGTAEISNGLVTAEKILGMDLRGTDMVVLSACRTGLGDVQAGEGVFGLRRAFTRAGTKSLVMSMWDVPDKETKELMTGFYENILSKKMDRCRALRQAELNQMVRVEKEYGAAHPRLWGAFVFMGES